MLLARAGRVDRARVVFERAVAFANDVGLLAGTVWPAPERGERVRFVVAHFKHFRER